MNQSFSHNDIQSITEFSRFDTIVWIIYENILKSENLDQEMRER